MKQADFWFKVDRKYGFMKRQREAKKMKPVLTRMMEVPSPVTPAEVEDMFQKYMAEFNIQSPNLGVQLTPEAAQCMRDAFYHGVLAILIRNAPSKGRVIH